MAKPSDFRKRKLLHVPLSEELYTAAFEIALRKGFDSVQQVVRLLLTAFADGELRPYFAIDLLKEKENKCKLTEKAIDIAKKRTDAEIKFLKERDEFEKQMNEQVLKDVEERMRKEGAPKVAIEEALDSYRRQQAHIWAQEKHAE